MSIKQLRAAIAPCCGLGANREHFESVQSNEHYSVELTGRAQLLTDSAPSQIDQIINELFSARWSGDLRNAPINKMREQLYKNLKDQLNGYWSGHTAYHILIHGGFIIDAPIGKKVATKLGQMFIGEMENSNDSLQTPYPKLSAPAQSVLVSLSKDEEIERHECQLLRIIIDRVTIPWDAGQSIKSIERRIKAAIEFRDFAKAERLNNVSIAIRNVHNYCQELLNATR
ncbi:hypothetical protein L9W80_09595 [Vibrio aestuarianus]|uniref:hypothetical protein n=1 Tax=Vibrio aestuarianus TaxID=28171 RepID=UPI00237CE60C|nr:hypothetical protein [Vibrio aestuarianus]MDE1350404.1 hypothetical protein [Vibrio aestuarianus]